MGRGLKFLLMVGLFLLPLGAAQAELKQFSGRDKKDNSRMVGLRLQAEGAPAYLFFLCDSDKTIPQILISHPQAFGGDADPFRFYYTPEGGSEQANWFLVQGSGKTAYFFVRYPIDYYERFGNQPDAFRAGQNALSDDYLAWDRNIYLTVVHDFATAKSVDVRIVDKYDITHLYTFKTEGMDFQLEVLKECYETPSLP